MSSVNLSTEPTTSPESVDFEPLIDRLIVHFTGDAWRAEVATAKKDFFQDAGIMDEKMDHFEMRMTQFLDWYLFTRPLAVRTVTPAQFALEIDEFVMTAQERIYFECLSETRHGLFEYLRLRGKDIAVRDLFVDKEVVIRESQVNIGFTREEIFDARLIPYGEDFIFARAFCFHPAEATTFIQSEIEKVQEIEDEKQCHQALESLLLRLMKMRISPEVFASATLMAVTICSF